MYHRSLSLSLFAEPKWIKYGFAKSNRNFLIIFFVFFFLKTTVFDRTELQIEQNMYDEFCSVDLFDLIENRIKPNKTELIRLSSVWFGSVRNSLQVRYFHCMRLTIEDKCSYFWYLFQLTWVLKVIPWFIFI